MPNTQHTNLLDDSLMCCLILPVCTFLSRCQAARLWRADMSADDGIKELVEFLMREEVARHVTAMYTLERIAAKDWARTRTLMAAINQVTTQCHPCCCPNTN